MDANGIPYDMWAVVFRNRGDAVVDLVPAPRSPEHSWALARIRVHASMVCASDRKILDGKFPATAFPHIPGHEFAGEVVDVGDGVFDIEPGMRVAPEAHVGCGACERCLEGLYNLCMNYGKPGHWHIGFTKAGGLAEYVTLPVKALHKLPDNISFAQGAWTDNLGVALWALERGAMRGGERVAVIGSGAIGLCAAQLARGLGAASVTLVGRGERLSRVARFADDVISDVQARQRKGQFDLVVEFAGTADGAALSIALARRGGRVVLGGATGAGVELSGVDLSQIVRGHLDIFGSVANPKGVTARALELLRRGLVDVEPLITHHFQLRDFQEAWTTFTERREGAIRVMLHPVEGS